MIILSPFHGWWYANQMLPEASLLPSIYDVRLTAQAFSFQPLTYEHSTFRTHNLSTILCSKPVRIQTLSISYPQSSFAYFFPLDGGRLDLLPDFQDKLLEEQRISIA